MTAGDSAGSAAAFLALPLGSRVVVRYRMGASATDALGLLLRRSEVDCDIRTRRGDVTVRFADIVAAKQVRPAPARRSARRDPPVGC